MNDTIPTTTSLENLIEVIEILKDEKKSFIASSVYRSYGEFN